MKHFLLNGITTALKAGDAILNIYERDFSVEYKDDNSPLTEADKLSHTIITTHLDHVYPILSEEGKNIPYSERKRWKRFWLIDPLDGTKEFIKKNGEFTVNIALIEKGVPVLGVVYAPAVKVLYYAAQGVGAFKIENSSFQFLENIVNETAFWKEIEKVSIPLPVATDRDEVVVVASRSHRNEETEKFIKELEEKYGKVETVSKGSSLKFCLVAEGAADIYPRIAPTMEWDTAAGDAVVRVSGGKVKVYGENKELVYNKENLLNPYFVVVRKNFFL